MCSLFFFTKSSYNYDSWVYMVLAHIIFHCCLISSFIYNMNQHVGIRLLTGSFGIYLVKKISKFTSFINAFWSVCKFNTQVTSQDFAIFACVPSTKVCPVAYYELLEKSCWNFS